MNNILRHLREGVIAWLTGPWHAPDPDPRAMDLRGIIWFVLQIWAHLAKHPPEAGAPDGRAAGGVLEAGFQLLMEIREKAWCRRCTTA